MSQLTLFKNPPKTLLNNTMRVSAYGLYADKIEHKEADLVNLLDKGHFRSIPFEDWDNKRNYDPIVSVSDLTPPVNARQSFLRDMAILLCYGERDLLTHETARAGDDEKTDELIDLFEQEFSDSCDNERFPRKLWKDIREGNGVWEKYL